MRLHRLELVTVAFFFAFAFSGLDADFLVVLLQRSQVFTSFGELTFFHTFTDVVVDEGTLGVQQVELVVDAAHHLRDSGGVGDHAHSAHDLGQVATRDNGRRLVVDAALEAGRGPVDELDGALGLDGGDGRVDVLGDDVAAVHEADWHDSRGIWCEAAGAATWGGGAAT